MNIAINITKLRIILYIANTLKLPFFKYFIKKFTTNIPTTKLANTPIQKANEFKEKSFNFTRTAAATIGVDNKNEYFAALSLSIFNPLATVIVIPERETPGKAAANA